MSESSRFPGGVVRRRWIFVAVAGLCGLLAVVFGCAGRIDAPTNGEGDAAGADADACPTCPPGAAAACPAAGVEICDGTDNDGDGVVDEGCGAPDGWTRTWGGTEADRGAAVALGSDGAVFVAGDFWGTVDFDAGPGMDSHTAAAQDAFLTKLDADGAHVWTRAWGGALADRAEAVAVGVDGAVVVGSVNGAVDLDPGPGVDAWNTGTVPGGFVVKLDLAGEYAWGRVLRGGACPFAGGLSALRVAPGTGGAVLVAGGFSYCIGFGFVPPSGDVDLRVAQSGDAFATRYGADGGYEWTATLGGTGGDAASDVAAGAGGAVFVTGDFGQSLPPSAADFDPGPRLDRRTPAGASDAFLTKLAL